MLIRDVPDSDTSIRYPAKYSSIRSLWINVLVGIDFALTEYAKLICIYAGSEGITDTNSMPK